MVFTPMGCDLSRLRGSRRSELQPVRHAGTYGASTPAPNAGLVWS